jgi:hypothetical protein
VNLMRVGWGIVVLVSIGLPVFGIAIQQQDASAPATTAGQASAPQTSQAVPPSEKKEEPPAPQPVTAEKKTDAGPSAASTVKRPARKKRAVATEGGPRKVIVPQGGVDEPTAQIVTGMAPVEAERQRQAAEQFLKSTDATLTRVGLGPFNALQEETVSQIRNYMEGARSALKEGDISRAHTLAEKADLLAHDLTRK